MNKVLRILHLEDDPDYSDLVKEMLEREGLRVEEVLVDNYADSYYIVELRDYVGKLISRSPREVNGVARSTPFLVSGSCCLYRRHS